MIELRDVALSFGERPLFERVNLELRHGEIALIRGRSGCGKTSLLRLISRFLPPTRGGLYLEQRPYREFRYQELRTRVVYIHQSPVMEQNLSVLETLLLPFSYAIHKDKEEPRVEEIQRLCASFHLDTEAISRQAGSLSLGEKQRVALIRAHLLRPEFLLLDEPLANLDEVSAGAIVAWVARQTLASTGLVIASHQPVNGLPDGKVRILDMSGGGIHERRN